MVFDLEMVIEYLGYQEGSNQSSVNIVDQSYLSLNQKKRGYDKEVDYLASFVYINYLEWIVAAFCVYHSFTFTHVSSFGTRIPGALVGHERWNALSVVEQNRLRNDLTLTYEENVRRSTNLMFGAVIYIIVKMG